MDNGADIKPELFPFDDDHTTEKCISLSDFERNIKNEIATNGTEFGMDNKANIKVEPYVSEVHTQNEGQCFSIYLGGNVKDNATTSNYDFEMDSKISIKDEPINSDAELLNEYLECSSVVTKESIMQKFTSDVTSQNDEYCSMDLVNKETVICFNRDLERITSPEIESQSVTTLPDISQANENEESALGKEIKAEDVPSSESPRLNAEARTCNCIRRGFTEVSLKGRNAYSLRPNRFHKDHRSTKICSSKSYCEKNVLDNEDNQPKCQICETRFSLKSALKIHQLIHEGKDSFKDKFYEYELIKTGQLKTGVEDKPHKYAISDLSIIPVKNLILKDKKPHECNICDETFNPLRDLKTHKLNHEVQKRHKCDVCDKSFTRPGYLKAHKLIHEGIRPYKCDVCDKSFTQLGHLKAHKLIHEGKKSHKCYICDTTFTRLGSLTRHKLIHDGKKPHKCNICDMSFTHLRNLKAHKWIHEGIKPHKCDICDKRFTRQGGLIIHKLIHEGKKPHKCDVCDMSFTQLGHLKTHKLIHEGKKPHK